jgi:hypothetical protein
MAYHELHAQEPSLLRQARVQVVGGEAVSVLEVPWQAALIREPSNTVFEGQFCGATLIDPFWVMTAAHCLDGMNPSDLKVVVGITRSNEANPQLLEVSQIIIHPAYARGTNIVNDIALLRLASPVNCSSGSCAPVAFASPADEAAGLLDPGVMAFVSGWGNTQRNGFVYPDSLHIASVPIISNGMANWPDAYAGLVTPAMLVAGDFENGGTDACQGDSGGPLVVPNLGNNGYLLAGIVSWGFGCGRPKFPGVYTRVPYFAEWLQQQTGIGQPDRLAQGEKVTLTNLILSQREEGENCVPGPIQLGIRFLLANEGSTSVDRLFYDIELKDLARQTTSLLQTGSIQFTEQLFAPGYSRMVETAISLNLPSGNYQLKARLKTGLEQEDIPAFAIATATLQRLPLETFLLKGSLPEAEEPLQWRLFNQNTNQLARQGILPVGSFEMPVCLPPGNYALSVDPLTEGTLEWLVFWADTLTTLARFVPQPSQSHAFSFQVPYQAVFQLALQTPQPFMQTCETVADLSLHLVNEGTIPVTQATLTVAPGQKTVEWNGFLTPGSRTALSIPSVTNDAPQTTFVCSLLRYANGQNQYDPETPATISIVVATASKPQPFTLSLTSDVFPEENHWLITDAQGRTVLQGGFMEERSVTTLLSACLNEGNYKFTLTDAFGDGILADTAVTLRSAGQVPVFSIRGDDFSSFVEKPFSLIHAPVLRSATEIALGKFRVEWEDLSDIEEGYEIALLEEGGELAGLFTTTANVTEAILDAVVGKSYILQIRAFTAYSFSDPCIALPVKVTHLAHTPVAEWQVFPNPCTHEIRFTTQENHQKAWVTLQDFSGKCMFRGEFMGDTHPHTLDVSRFPRGAYLLLIETQGSRAARKILLK